MGSSAQEPNGEVAKMSEEDVKKLNGDFEKALLDTPEFTSTMAKRVLDRSNNVGGDIKFNRGSDQFNFKLLADHPNIQSFDLSVVGSDGVRDEVTFGGQYYRDVINEIHLNYGKQTSSGKQIYTDDENARLGAQKVLGKLTAHNTPSVPETPSQA